LKVRKTADAIVCRWLDEKGHIFASEDATREGSTLATATLWVDDAHDEDE
jgi:hypothetical protein